MNTTPPWSRRRCTHPDTRTRSPRASATPAQVWLRYRDAPIIRSAPRPGRPGAPRRCSPLSMSRTVATPSACSRAPTITAWRAPSDDAWRIIAFRLRPRSSLSQRSPAARRRSTTGISSTRRSSSSTATKQSRRAAGVAVGRFQGQHDPLDARPEADAGGGRPAQGLDQAVVAAAAADGALGPQVVAGELEDGHRVVVEAAHEGRVLLVGDPQPVEGPEDALAVGLGGRRQVVEQAAGRPP